MVLFLGHSIENRSNEVTRVFFLSQSRSVVKQNQTKWSFCTFDNQVKTALFCKTYFQFLVEMFQDVSDRMHFFSSFHQELFESLEEKLEEDLIEALAALSLSKAMYDAKTLDQAMQASHCPSLSSAYKLLSSCSLVFFALKTWSASINISICLLVLYLFKSVFLFRVCLQRRLY